MKVNSLSVILQGFHKVAYFLKAWASVQPHPHCWGNRGGKRFWGLIGRRAGQLKHPKPSFSVQTRILTHVYNYGIFISVNVLIKFPIPFRRVK